MSYKFDPNRTYTPSASYVATSYTAGRGKTRRLKLGPREMVRMLKVGYADYLAGRVTDRRELLQATGDSRIHAIAGEWLASGQYQDALMAYILEQDELATKVRQQRLERAGMIPVVTPQPSSTAPP